MDDLVVHVLVRIGLVVVVIASLIIGFYVSYNFEGD